MAKRRCLDCPALGDWRRTRGRCPNHQPTAEQRGYGADHRAERTRWQIILDAGHAVPCANPHCLTPNAPVDPKHWHLGHTPDRTGHRGPEHPACNLNEAGRAPARNSHMS